jgi:hypothetical protein
VKSLLFLLVLSLLAGSCSRRGGPVEHVSITSGTYEEACIYGFPMIVAYQAMYQFNVDKTSPPYKVLFNQIWSESHDFSPTGSATTTASLDTSYSPCCDWAYPRDRGVESSSDTRRAAAFAAT